jgi:SAM-dependent methyltransferase
VKALLDDPRLYALWQAPFVRQKLAPFHRHNDVSAIRRVLDVGCGPGTNAREFGQAEYLGIDLDASYVARARARFGDKFRQGDAAHLAVADFGPVDCLFVNSLTHHLDDAALAGLLSRVELVLPEGHLHLIDLHLPPSGIARRLALADRGRHARPLEALRDAIARHWVVDVEEQFTLRLPPFDLWAMVYFRAARRNRT